VPSAANDAVFRDVRHTARSYHRRLDRGATQRPPAARPWLMGIAKLPEDVVNGYKWELYNHCRGTTRRAMISAAQDA